MTGSQGPVAVRLFDQAGEGPFTDVQVAAATCRHARPWRILSGSQRRPLRRRPRSEPASTPTAPAAPRRRVERVGEHVDRLLRSSLLQEHRGECLADGIVPIGRLHVGEAVLQLDGVAQSAFGRARSRPAACSMRASTTRWAMPSTSLAGGAAPPDRSCWPCRSEARSLRPRAEPLFQVAAAGEGDAARVTPEALHEGKAVAGVGRARTTSASLTWA